VRIKTAEYATIIVELNQEVKLAKPNYSYEKRQKELAKKKKQEEKRKRKQGLKSEASSDDPQKPE